VLPITRKVTTTFLQRTGLAALALTVAFAGSADAATKHRVTKPKRTPTAKTAKQRTAAKPVASVALVPAPAQAATPTPAATPVNSVISIGGYVFYGLTYAEAVAAYEAAVAAHPGYTPPPVTSISVDTTVGN
jgi:hypothetical protein